MRLRPRRPWVLMTTCRGYLPLDSREVSRHWTKRSAESAYARWELMPASQVWLPMIVHVDEMEAFFAWLKRLGECQQTPSTVSTHVVKTTGQ